MCQLADCHPVIEILFTSQERADERFISATVMALLWQLNIGLGISIQHSSASIKTPLVAGGNTNKYS